MTLSAQYYCFATEANNSSQDACGYVGITANGMLSSMWGVHEAH